MKKKSDPKWIQAIDRSLGAVLYLYPSDYRKEYGPMIRQAMRDRCREVVKGQRSLFRVVALELIPDIVLGAGREQINSNFGQLTKRHYVALSLLVALSFVGLFRESVSKVVFDQTDVAAQKVDSIERKRNWENDREKIEEFAQWLVEKDRSPKSKVLAAYLYQSLHLQVHGTDMGKEKELTPCEHQKKADKLIQEVLNERPDAMVLAIALRSCNSESGCDRAKILNRLVDYDENNAYVWQVSLRWAIKEKNEIAERYALKRIAASNRNINYEQKIRTELLSYLKEYSPSDADLSEGLFYLNLTNFDYTGFALANSHCWNLHKESRDIEFEQDCKRAADVLSSSSDLSTTGRQANIILYRLSSNQFERSAAYQQLHNIYWWQEAYYEGYTPGVNDSWNAHVKSWMQSDGSIEAIQASLRDHGKPTTAPPDFDISESLRHDFDIVITEADQSLGLKEPGP